MAEVPLSYREELIDGWSDAQRSAVIEELNLIVSHPLFKSSNHCVALLRYVVDHAISRSGTPIKERTLGVEVFGRSANYDVGNDPVVRRIASEIRKKLAQYYQERGSAGPVRIHLVRGSYVPEFEFVSEAVAVTSGMAATRLEEPVTVREMDSRVLELPVRIAAIEPRHRQRNWLLGTVAAAAMAIAIFAVVRWMAFRSPDYRVWKPLLDSSDAITVCLPIHNLASNAGISAEHGAAANGNPTPQAAETTSEDSDPSTLFRDVDAGSVITALFSNFKKKTDLRPWTALRVRDFQQAPAVLIGGPNNPWVPVLLPNIRFTVHYDHNTRDAWIQDAQNPSGRDWLVEGGSRNQTPVADYAVITRLFNQQTNQWVMALSGLMGTGTEAAAELVTDPKYSSLIPAGISGKGNFQIVVRTTLIGGEPGPIQVLAVQTW